VVGCGLTLTVRAPPFPSSSRNPNRGHRSGSNVGAKVLSSAPSDNTTTGLHLCRRRRRPQPLSLSLSLARASGRRVSGLGFSGMRGNREGGNEEKGGSGV